MNYNGIWLEIKGPDYYGKPRFITFGNEGITFYTFTDNVGNPELVKEPYKSEAPVKVEIIDDNRLRFFKKAKHTSFYNDKPRESKDIVIEKDYQTLLPTVSSLTDEEIAAQSYSFTRNSENIKVVFNEITDIPYIQEMNKRLGRDGSKIILERFHDTLFLAFYSNGNRDNITPIKEVDTTKIVLYAFPKEPFEVIGSVI